MYLYIQFTLKEDNDRKKDFICVFACLSVRCKRLDYYLWSPCWFQLGAVYLRWLWVGVDVSRDTWRTDLRKFNNNPYISLRYRTTGQYRGHKSISCTYVFCVSSRYKVPVKFSIYLACNVLPFLHSY